MKNQTPRIVMSASVVERDMATKNVPRPDAESNDEGEHPMGVLPWQAVVRLAHQRALGEE